MIVGSHSGNPVPLMAGILQGATLSPTLYNIFASDTLVPRRGDSLDITEMMFHKSGQVIKDT